MSLLHFAAASQFIGIKLISTGIPIWEITFTTFLINSRYFLMAFSIMQKFPKTLPKLIRFFLGFFLTDEIFTISSLKNKEQIDLNYFSGLCLTPYLSWFLGTIIGISMANTLPPIIKNSMDIALYAMFIGLLIPSVKKSKAAFSITLISIALSSFINWIPTFSKLPAGWSIIIATTVSAIMGAIFFPIERNIKQ